MKRKKTIKGLAAFFAIIATIIGAISIVTSFFKRDENKKIHFHENND